MKKILQFASASVLLLSVMLMVNSCKKAGPIGGYTCSEQEEMCGTQWKACCNGIDCYYQAGAKKYNCDGDDCAVAATKLINDLCGTSVDLKSLTVTDDQAELLEVIQMLIEANEPCDE